MIILHVSYTLKDPRQRNFFCAALAEEGVLSAGPVTALLDRNPDPEALLRTVLSGFDVELLESSREYRLFFPADREEEAFLLEIWDDPVSMATHKATKQFYRLQELKTGYVLATAVKKYELPGIAH